MVTNLGRNVSGENRASARKVGETDPRPSIGRGGRERGGAGMAGVRECGVAGMVDMTGAAETEGRGGA